MYYSRNKRNKKWQKKFINDVFNNRANIDDTFSKTLINNIEKLESKVEYIPNSICKYYTPTSENIIDIQNRRLWLSHPSAFNDPFDSYTGYDISAFEKHTILEFIKHNGTLELSNQSEGFTEDEKNRIIRSKVYDDMYFPNNKYEQYDDVIWKILKLKSDDFRHSMHALIGKAREDIEDKIRILRNSNIRISCFSEFNRYESFQKNIQMWSHYASNHRGFCVEYDLSFLKEKTSYSFSSDSGYYIDKNKYLEEKLIATIKAGLFPVIYSSNRINIPVTKLKKLKKGLDGNLKNNIDIDNILYKTYIVKSANWSYEREWRLIIDGNISDFYDHKLPFPFIKRIYLGCMMDNDTIDLMFEIGKELNVETVLLKMDSKRFILEETSSFFREWEKREKSYKNPFK